MKKSNEIPQYDSERILADNVNDFVGSGKFIAGQSIFLIVYIIFQAKAPDSWAFDRYPFILLNLLLSFQAAYTGPFVLWSQNRAALRDRLVITYIKDMVGSIKQAIDSLIRMEKRMDKELKEMNAMILNLSEENQKLTKLVLEMNKKLGGSHLDRFEGI